MVFETSDFGVWTKCRTLWGYHILSEEFRRRRTTLPLQYPRPSRQGLQYQDRPAPTVSLTFSSKRALYLRLGTAVFLQYL